ncbi:MAG TPA: AAA family ATPase [Hymenobacter sp.]|uniref:AAA family ATPase n=1 Tax=Hymenobacter sp. TaxID=1898978 RepID=UPI002D80784F|nr:AAA family ATPase [Hymenobacter sp.]HET9503981.1 AAA family ATPase [Hymenobacter sp.]
MPTSAQAPAVPRLTYLRIKNYRALRDVEFRDLTPLTVLIGPNGSGKSTVLDALDFLAEAVRGNLVAAWEKRDRFRGMRTRGEEGSIEFQIEFSLADDTIIYNISIIEKENGVEVKDEKLINGTSGQRIFYRRGKVYNRDNSPVEYLTDFNPGWGSLQEQDDVYLAYGSVFLSEYAGMMDKVLSDLLRYYRLLHLTDDHLKGYSDAGPREKLSPNGDNLPNVFYYLHLKHPEVLERLADKLRAWVPGLADVIPEITSDERLLLRFKDAPFEKPLPAQYMSGGTMRLAALLTLLYEPNATGLLGIEEPENELHPQLLGRLAEELIKATETRQLLVATHSPAILNALEPAQVWILHRGSDGYTQATRVADLPGIPEMVEEGSPLGYLWTRNFFEVGDPLAAPNATEGH